LCLFSPSTFLAPFLSRGSCGRTLPTVQGGAGRDCETVMVPFWREGGGWGFVDGYVGAGEVYPTVDKNF